MTYVSIADYLPDDKSLWECENMNRTDLTEQEQAQNNLDHYLKGVINKTNASGFWMIAMRLKYVHSAERINTSNTSDENSMFSVKESSFSFFLIKFVVH